MKKSYCKTISPSMVDHLAIDLISFPVDELQFCMRALWFTPMVRKFAFSPHMKAVAVLAESGVWASWQYVCKKLRIYLLKNNMAYRGGTLSRSYYV